MKWVVLGGAGFIGSNLVLRLLAAHHEVVVVDDLSTGRRANLPAHEWLTFINADISSRDAMDPYQKFWHGAAYIVNLACPASPPQYQAMPVHTLLTCTQGTYHGLAAAFTHKARFIQASTSEVYGDPEQHPQHESYRGNVNTWGPRACYDEGKRCAEAFCYEYQKLGCFVRVARLFNTYGPGMRPDDGRVVSNFIMQALRGEDLTIHGDGDQTRSFCYVDDTIEGLLTLGRSALGSPTNIGNTTEFNVLELAERVLSLTGSTSKIVHLDLPKDDPIQRQPVIDRMMGIGWYPQVGLEEGLTKTIEYFRSLL